MVEFHLDSLLVTEAQRASAQVSRGPGGLHRKGGAAEGHQEESEVQKGPKANTWLYLFVPHCGSDRQVHVVKLKAVSRASVRKCYFVQFQTVLLC